MKPGIEPSMWTKIALVCNRGIRIHIHGNGREGFAQVDPTGIPVFGEIKDHGSALSPKWSHRVTVIAEERLAGINDQPPEVRNCQPSSASHT